MPDVLIVGVSTRAAADSAARAGYDVTALDAFGDLDQSPGVRALSVRRDFGVPFTARAAASVAKEIDCTAVAYVSPLENHPPAVRRLAKGRVLLGNTPEVLERVRDPMVLAAVLERRGAPAPRCAEGSSSTTWLLKPRRSGGGHGVRPWSSGQHVPRGYYLQERIDGTPGSIAFVAAGGRAVPLGLTRQLVGDPAFGASGFGYCGNILVPAGEPAFGHDGNLLRSSTALAKVVAEEFGLVGVNGIDFVARDGTAYPIEVNPRYSAAMELVERTLGVSIFGVHGIACTTGDLPSFDLDPARRGHRAVGKTIVFARHEVVCGDTRTWLDDPSVRDVPHPGERIPAGRPVCTVFADGADSTTCYAALVDRANAVYAALESWATAAV